MGVTVGLEDMGVVSMVVGLEDMGVVCMEEVRVVMDIHHMVLLRPYYD